ncbi:MAG: hypothetical protein HQ536_00010 [Parcubacteria group bacterium]|nr:hypothetical protein [Parcubacteria group bacterium]
MYVDDSCRAINLSVVDEENPNWKIEDLMHLFFLSIRNSGERCLHSNFGVIYMTLSGGIASSFCLAVLRDIFGFETPIHTYTIARNAKDQDYIFAARMARIFNTQHFCVNPSEKAIEHAKTYMGKNPTAFGERVDNEDVANFLLYQFISEFKDGERSVITHTGVDHLLGGYWPNWSLYKTEEKKEMFGDSWKNLSPDCLIPLRQKSTYFGFDVLLPFLQKSLVEFVSHIPVEDRVKQEFGNVPLRAIASHYLPEEVMGREKQTIKKAVLI